MKRSRERELNEFPILVRFNKAIPILRKVRSMNEPTLDLIAGSISPFGISTTVRGEKFPSEINNIKLYSSSSTTFISDKDIVKGKDLIGKFKVIVGILGAEHALEPDKDGKFRIITSSMKVLGPNEVCSHSYFIIGGFDKKDMAENLLGYLRCKFTRFLILLSMTSTHLSRNVLLFLPQQDFSKQHSDCELYQKYNLNPEEIEYIESLIKEMI